LEHLGPRVAEREYSYGAQLKVSLSANVAGLLALGVGLLFARTHVAFIVSMYVQVVVQVAASHLLAKEPYTVAFRTRHFRGAFRFGYPLMVNGFGLAASNNGDRFLIGAMLGLPSLAVYAVVTLATIVPLGLVSRVTGPVMLAALYNAGDRGSYDARLRLAARVLTMVSAFYAVGVASLVNVVVPIVFGEKFTLSPTAAALLAASLFIRVARGDPFTGMLLHEGRTRRLAVANLCSASSLGFEVVFLYAFHSFEAVMAGRLAGEVVGMVATILATRDLFKPAIVDFAKAFAMGSIVLAAAITAVATIPAPQYLMGSFVVVVSFVVMASWGAYFVPSLLEAGYPNIRIRNGLPA
jgi:O-antigen/teichoic acid export membrane protein